MASLRQISGQVVVDTDRFDDDFAMLHDGFGFAVDAIWPADAPSVAVLSGHGLTVRLVATQRSVPVTLMLVTSNGSHSAGVTELPGGSRVIVEPEVTGYDLPYGQPELVISPADGATVVGRAGMRYRDLLPNRWGGRFIASLISIPEGGLVPDYVHFHRVRFQLIFVKSGWVRVVYEDQGDPFVLQTGDAVLQVPEIRHRVLEASRGLEVIEVTSPAEHITIADRDLELPNGLGDPARRWDGQAFVHHRAVGALDDPWDIDGWVARDTGIGEATGGLAGVRVARPLPTALPPAPSSASAFTTASTVGAAGEFRQLVVLSGAVSAVFTDRRTRLSAGASVALPARARCELKDATSDCELLDIALPAL